MEESAAAESLADLRAAVEAYEGCQLKQYATRTVFSDGNPYADIMLIGEAPGAQEDAQGKPFVGRSGKLLDQMLQAIGLNRAESAYITNVTFWRPPDNRNPTPAELESCRPFVNRHIALINPKILVLVGGVPTKHMLQTTTGIKKLRGQWQALHIPGVREAIPTLPIFHPAYLLRNPPAKREAWSDMQALRDRGEQLGVAFGPMQKQV
jgi:DNA polymerase